MKKVFIPLLTAVVVVSIVFAGCAPAPAPPAPAPPAPAPPAPAPPAPAPPAPAPPAPAPEITEWGLELNPYEGLAIKPDGTPYKIANTQCFSGCEWMVVAEGVIKSLVERSGAEYTYGEPDFIIDLQVAFLEDQITVHHPDALIVQPVEESMVVPVVEKAVAAGIPVFNWDLIIPSDAITSVVYHDFDGPAGTYVVGEFFRQTAEETGKHIYLYELWGPMGMQSMYDRHDGLLAGIAGSPLVTVLESADTQASDEISASFVMDAFTAHPELNAVYHQCGGSTGVVEGLRAIGRLLPLGDPNHVYCCTNDTDSTVVEGMDEDVVDACGSHGPWDLTDTIVKIMWNNIILGKPAPMYVVSPMTLVTPENMDTGLLLGGLACWPRMPAGQWDKWPVLDSWTYPLYDEAGNEIRIETPTKAMRKELMGY